MLSSKRVGQIFGIDIKIHPLFWVMIIYFLVTARPENRLVTLLFLFILFGCVLLHELGHSLVAQRMGIRVHDITFWPLGGMARLSHMPRDPKSEIWIAVAGPAVNFALVGMTMLATHGVRAGLDVDLAAAARPFLLINLMLGGFNLLPAFPMDGGRVLRALLAMKRPYVEATARAVAVGRWFGWTMIAYAVLGPCASTLAGRTLPDPGLSVALIGAFLLFAGKTELRAARQTQSPFGFGEADRPPEIAPGALDDIEQFKGRMDEFFKKR